MTDKELWRLSRLESIQLLLEEATKVKCVAMLREAQRKAEGYGTDG